MIGLNWLDILLGLVLPMLVALVTNNVAAGGWKAIVLALLAAISGVVQELVNAAGVLEGFDWDTAASHAVWTFLFAVGLHFGLLKPVGITGKDNVIQNAQPRGIGAPPEQ